MSVISRLRHKRRMDADPFEVFAEPERPESKMPFGLLAWDDPERLAVWHANREGLGEHLRRTDARPRCGTCDRLAFGEYRVDTGHTCYLCWDHGGMHGMRLERII